MMVRFISDGIYQTEQIDRDLIGHSEEIKEDLCVAAAAIQSFMPMQTTKTMDIPDLSCSTECPQICPSGCQVR